MSPTLLRHAKMFYHHAAMVIEKYFETLHFCRKVYGVLQLLVHRVPSYLSQTVGHIVYIASQRSTHVSNPIAT